MKKSDYHEIMRLLCLIEENEVQGRYSSCDANMNELERYFRMLSSRYKSGISDLCEQYPEIIENKHVKMYLVHL
jgi:hypothetical protein